MRHLSYVLCASIAACGYTAVAAVAANPTLALTLDLLSPCTPAGCGNTIHPTDIGLDVVATSFTYAPGTANSFVATLGVTTPVVCDEIRSGGLLGPVSSLRLSPMFSNSTAGGGLLEFNAGGASVVDLNAMTYDGSNPQGVAATYSNYGTTLPPQVLCYHVTPINGGPAVIAAGPYGIFASSFDSGHLTSEPWVSVQTVSSPRASGSKAIHINGITLPSAMGYVVQVHNAAHAIGWHLDLGYDYNFFDSVSNGGTFPIWCVLDGTVPQPGPINGSPATCGSTAAAHTFGSADIQAGSDSIYVYVENTGSAAAISNWSSLNNTTYPAIAAVFPPFTTYPQRLDDKTSVASANNLPTPNVGSIVCNNDTTSTACVILNQDGNAVPAAVTFAHAITSGGTVNIDPLAYFVDPSGGTTLPGNTAADELLVSNVSCGDPSGILASPIGAGNFSTSPTAQGGEALGFGFKPSGSPNFPYVAGTANCAATFTTSGHFPVLSNTQSFTITMNQAAVGSVTESAASGQTAAPGGSLIYNVVVANAGSSTLAGVVVTDNQNDAMFVVNSWTCSGGSCPAPSGNTPLNQTILTLPAGSSVTYAVSGTVGAIASNPVTQISNTASISVPGGSCAGGNCSSNASVLTVPIIQITKTVSEPSYHTNDQITYTIALTNQGGTPATGLLLTDAVPSGVTFDSWTCSATGTGSACSGANGSAGDINESSIAIDAGGSVTYSVMSTVTSTGGTVTNTATAGLGAGMVCYSNLNACASSVPMTLAVP